MFWVSFQTDSGPDPPEHPAGHSQLRQAVPVTPQPGNDFDQKALLHRALEPLQICFWADESEIVAMDEAAQIVTFMPIASKTCNPPGEAHLLELGAQERLPSSPRIPCHRGNG